jgi:argininosuccinate lyase
MSPVFDPAYVARVLDPSYRNWRRLYYRDSVRVHRAHLVMLLEKGIVGSRTAARLKAAMGTIDASSPLPESIPAGTEDLYFAYEAELERLAGPEEAAYLHTARSRNDMDTTVFRLALKRELLALIENLRACFDAILARARRGEGELTILYTHGQPANVSTTAHYLTAFLLDLLEGTEALLAAMGSTDLCSLGACAITGTGFPVDRRRTASLLGFRAPVANSYRAISTSHWLVMPAQALRLLLGDAGRFAADLLHKASCDFPDELVQASSIMPQKRNPVILEHVRIQAGMAAGACASVEELFRNVPYQDVNEVADAPVTMFIDALATASSCFDLLRATIAGMGVNEDRAREIASRFGVTTTELADRLVRECGIGFRSAHRICGVFVRSGRDKDNLRRAFRESTGTDLAWPDETIDEALGAELFVAVRRTEGGPSPEGMASVYEAIDAAMARIDAALDEVGERGRKADAALDAAWAAIR